MKAVRLTMLALLVLIVAATTAAAQNQVYVPGNASGFGNPNYDQVPLVPAITVSKPSLITVTYVSGLVTDGFPLSTGPEGKPCPAGCGQLPLEEAKGVYATGMKYHLDALIGVFVPQTTVHKSGFYPLDGTKGVVPAGIMPMGLFLIGKGKTFQAYEAGTLFLGINDNWVGDNGGGFNVTVSAQ